MIKADLHIHTDISDGSLTTEEAIKMAKEALGLHLYGIEEENETLPVASNIRDLSLEKNQIPILIDIGF